MKPEEQRIAIAKALDLEIIDKGNLVITSSGACLLVRRKGKKELTDWFSHKDWLSDLNAIHEAEKTLNAEEKKSYVAMLYDVANAYTIDDDPYIGSYFEVGYETVPPMVMAIASHRAEIFLRAKGLWK